MSTEKIWYGYLEADTKSSPILRDPNLDTKNKDTIYLFNLQKGAILEYNLTIVEPKLRNLTKEENALIIKLKSNYKKARKTFFPRGVIIKTTTDEPIVSPVDTDSMLELDFAS